MTLLIVRHGQTVWNTQHRMQGQQDSPLTELGRELARRLAVRLEGVHIDRHRDQSAAARTGYGAHTSRRMRCARERG